MVTGSILVIWSMTLAARAGAAETRGLSRWPGLAMGYGRLWLAEKPLLLAKQHEGERGENTPNGRGRGALRSCAAP